MELFKLLGRIAIDNTEANTAINETTNNAQDSEKKQKKSFKGIGTAASVLGKGMIGVGAAIGGSFVGAVEGTREYRKEMGLLESAFLTAGHSSETAKKTYSELNAVLGDSGQAVEASQHLAKITDDEKELQTWTNICTGVYSEFGEAIPIESLTESALEVQKNGQLTGGLVDALVWAGINEEEFQAKLDACTTEQERQDLIMNTLNSTYSDAAEQYKETNKDIMDAEKANERLSDAMGKLGSVGESAMTLLKNALSGAIEFILPFIEQFATKIPSAVETTKGKFDIVLPYIQKAWQGLWSVLQTIWNTVGKQIFEFIVQQVQKVVVFFQQNFPKIQKVVQDVFSIIKSLWENVLKPVLTILGNFLKNTLLPIWNTVFDGIMKVVKVAFDGIINLWNKSLKPILNGIIEFVSGVLTGDWSKAWNGLKKIVVGVFDGVVEAVETAKDFIETAIDNIIGFFDVTLKFSGISLPDISIKWATEPAWMYEAAQFVGLKGIPKFSVTWNAEGAIFGKPTIIPTLNGLQGVGDGGQEAVAPIDTLMQYVRTAVQEENKDLITVLNMVFNILNKYLPELSGMKIVLDSGVMVGELTPAIDQELGHISNRKMRK